MSRKTRTTGAPGRNRRDPSRWQPRDNNGVARQNFGTSLRDMRRLSNRDLTTFGLVVFAQVPFVEDPTQSKTRPVVVVGSSDDGDTIYVHPISSSPQGMRNGLPLQDWSSVGLTRPCAVQHRLVSLNARTDFSATIGKLAAGDEVRVEYLLVNTPVTNN